MPVPSAYNDITEDMNVRDHVGWVWYQYKFYPRKIDQGYRTFLRFSSVNYYADVVKINYFTFFKNNFPKKFEFFWFFMRIRIFCKNLRNKTNSSIFKFFNSKSIGNHTGGHLPFQLEVELNFSKINKITLAVNNTLSSSTIPPGDFSYKTSTTPSGIHLYPPGFFEQTPNFDFFNYAGILRPVYLLKMSKSFIKEVKLQAFGNGETIFLGFWVVFTNSNLQFVKKINFLGNLSYRVEVDSNLSAGYRTNVLVTSLKSKKLVYQGKDLQADVQVQNVDLWNPRGYGEPNLHEIEVRRLSYREPRGQLLLHINF